MESAQLEERREELEDQLRFYQQRYKDLTRKIDEEQQRRTARPTGAERRCLAEANGEHVQIDYATSFYEAERGRTKRAVERIRGQLRAVDAEVGELEREIARRFHPYWGSLLKEANETSELRRPGGGVRLHLHVARLEPARLLAAAVLPQPARPDAARALIAEASAPVRGRRHEEIAMSIARPRPLFVALVAPASSSSPAPAGCGKRACFHWTESKGRARRATRRACSSRTQAA